ncbi:hypothetical protein [Allobaculum sp. JKK-2023]|uniref:hypothetical protein n=1 Tax=Allobaculum sp. JKK-2023 TaxID=3108943 RepID=UPI002B05C42E|nr:hypothetical protein [Allobaculum sp. JKK-2023]
MIQNPSHLPTKIEIIQAITISPFFEKAGLESILTVGYVETHKYMKELFSHSAAMDIFAVDDKGNLSNIELQISGLLFFARVETALR